MAILGKEEMNLKNTMKKVLILFLIFLLFSNCAHLRWNKFKKHWLGASCEQLYTEWGKPDRVVPFGESIEIWCYDKILTRSAMGTYPVFNNYGYEGFYTAPRYYNVSVTYLFWINKKTGRIFKIERKVK